MPAKTNNQAPKHIATLIKDKLNEPVAIINAKSLAAIMENREPTKPVSPIATVKPTKLSENISSPLARL